MKSALVLCSLMVIAVASEAGSTRVKGYTKKDGTYVQPHMRTTPDSSRLNNWSTQGNTNPYNGKSGTEPLYKPLKYR